MFGDSDGSKDANPGAPPSTTDPPFPNRELTLSSYLCEKPTLASAAAGGGGGAGPSSPPNPAAAAAGDDGKHCVERDFSTSPRPSAGSTGDDSSVVGGKKPRLDSSSLAVP